MSMSPMPGASLGLAIAMALWTAPALAQDVAAAQALAKKSGCTKCHSVSAKKEGPSYQETAAKYKGKADSEEKLYKHLTTSPMVEVDGRKEEHAGPKTKDEAEIRNLVKYILAQ